MLCSTTQLRRQDLTATTVKLLPCGSWDCEVCQSHRRKQLMAIAASGLPRICLTLTHYFRPGADQAAHYRELHAAWKMLVKRILRQFKKPPEQRWILKSEDGFEYQDLRDNYITSKTRAGRIKRLHYMAFAEETENGEPHLHILLRTVFIPQRWISQQMQELIASPITWIEKIKGAKAAIAYVTKYVTKAPAKFGNSKRYWISRWYQLKKWERTKAPLYERINNKIVFQVFSEFIREIVVSRSIPRVTGPRTIELYTPSRSGRSLDPTTIFQEDAEGVRSYLWLMTWRQRLRV